MGLSNNIAILIIVFLFGFSGQSIAQEGDKSTSAPQENRDKIIGFEDKDQDGINDCFVDANGDGRNDVDNKAYKHTFKFADKNDDKINDLWVDRDGDGVNDISFEFTMQEKQMIRRNVLDANEDGFNDVTGEKYDAKNHNWMGRKWGFWNEDDGELQGSFIDADADGIDDRLNNDRRNMGHGPNKMKRQDTFIDEDGDGICDWRTDFLNQMGNHGKSKHMGGKNKNNGSHH